MDIALITAGSQGDVRPFVALGRGLQRAGHTVTLAAPSDAESLATAHGVPFVSLGMDFQALAASPAGRGALAGRPVDILRLIRRAQSITRTMLDVGGRVALAADAAVCHPKTLVAPHIAEATGQPVWMAAPVPVLAPTRAFPIPVGVFPDLGPLNRLTYAVTRLGMLPYHRLVSAWRDQALGLPPRPWWADPLAVDGTPLPVLYALSSTVVPRPPDWPDSVHVTGRWVLEDQDDETPGAAQADGVPPGLDRFLADGAPPVYVGFGSMTGADPRATTATVLQAVRRTGVRAVLATGWGGLAPGMHQVERSPMVHVVASAPHAWLFPRCAAVVHHGGAGTTDAGLRAGRPSVVCPFFGDQSFWGRRVQALGAGPAPIPQKTLTPARLAAALRDAVGMPQMRRNAERVGRALRRERGVARAVQIIEHAG